MVKKQMDMVAVEVIENKPLEIFCSANACTIHQEDNRLPYFSFCLKASENRKLGHLYRVAGKQDTLMEGPYRIFYLTSRRVLRFLDGDQYTKRYYVKDDEEARIKLEEDWREALASLIVVEKDGFYALGTIETAGASTSYWASILRPLGEQIKTEVKITDHGQNFVVSKKKMKYPSSKMFRQIEFMPFTDNDKEVLTSLAIEKQEQIKDFLER